MANNLFRHAVRLGLLALAVAASLVFAPGAVAQAPCESEIPAINRVALSEVSLAGAAVEAEIDPRGRETAYEFSVVWQEANPPHGERPPAGVGVQAGRIVAGSGEVTVHALLSGLQPGHVYWYELVASNSAGEARAEARMFNYFYTGGFPEGTGGGAPYRSVEPCWAIESAGRAAEEAVKTYREREAARAAEEAAARARLAAEEAAKRQREAGALAPVQPTRCLVPNLRGDSLRGARRTLTRAHCRLGAVTRPRHFRGALVVTGQSPRRGHTLSNGASVAVTLGPPRHRHRP
jgi:hypothetical protein